MTTVRKGTLTETVFNANPEYDSFIRQKFTLEDEYRGLQVEIQIFDQNFTIYVEKVDTFLKLTYIQWTRHDSEHHR